MTNDSRRPASPGANCGPVERRMRDVAEVRARSSSPLARELAGLLMERDEREAEEPREGYREYLWRRYGGR